MQFEKTEGNIENNEGSMMKYVGYMKECVRNIKKYEEITYLANMKKSKEI